MAANKTFTHMIRLKILTVFLLSQNIQFSFDSNSDLNKFNDLNPRKGCTKDKKTTEYNNASEICNDYLKIYFDEYKTLSDAEKEEIGR